MFKIKLASWINRLIQPIGIQIVSNIWLDKLIKKYALGNGLVGAAEFGMCVPHDSLGFSLSQRGQDIIAFFSSGGSSTGYFVEIGGADGLVGSNTYLLERLGWEGLVVEPARVWRKTLDHNRACSKDFRAVFSESGLELEFVEKGELSTLVRHKNDDYHRRWGPSYNVETVSPSDLFVEHDCPEFIDFLSLDTEGSELEILRSIDFERYRFGLICVEHNYTPNRELIEEHLKNKGYEIFMEQDSLNDSFYRPLIAPK